MNVWCLVISLLLADPAAGTATAAPLLPNSLGASSGERPQFIQAIQIPDENLIEQIRRFLPGQAESMSPVTFAEMLERYRQSFRWSVERRPLEGRLRGTMDPISGLLKGTSVWAVDSRGGERISFQPWNLLVRRVKPEKGTAERPIFWGASDSSSLVVIPSMPGDRVLEVDWEQQGVRRPNGFDFRFRLPTNSLNSLELSIPPKWSLVSDGVVASREEVTDKLLLPDSTGTILFSLMADESRSTVQSVSSGLGRVECVVGEEGIAVRARMEITRIGSREKGVRLTIRAPAGRLRPKGDQGGDWTLLSSQPDETSWLFVPSGPFSDRLSVEFEGTLEPSWPDGISGGTWEPPFVGLQDGELLSEEIVLVVPSGFRLTSLSPGSFRYEATTVDEDRALRVSFRGSDRSTRPTISVSRRRPILQASGGMQLDLSHDPPRVTADFQLSLDSGERNVLEAALPPRWKLASARMDSGLSITSIQSSQGEDGWSMVLLPLPRPLTASSPGRLEMVAELDSIRKDSAAEIPLSLPEIRVIDSRVRGGLAYRLILDPQVPVNLERLPAPKVNVTGGSTVPGGEYVFEYLTPLPEMSIDLLPSLPRFRASLDHVLRWRQSDWRQEWRLDLDVLQGSLETLHLVSNRPLPEGIVWRTQDQENSVIGFERFPESITPGPQRVAFPPREEAPDEPAEEPLEEEAAAGSNDGSGRGSLAREYHYQIRMAFPVRKSIRLTAEWTDAGRAIEPPLLQLPDAQDLSALVSIESRTGRSVQIESQGLVRLQSDSSSLDEGRSVIWSGQYDPLERQASLKLRVSDGPSLPGPETRRAVMVCVSRLEDETVVQTIDLILQNPQPCPLQVRLPEESYVWQVQLDGVSGNPGVRRGVLEISPLLEPGVHSCRLVFSLPVKRFWGLVHVTFPDPLEDWDTVSSTWTIERQWGAYLFADRSLRLLSNLQTIERGPADRMVALTDTAESRETISRLQSAFSGLPENERESTPEVLTALSSSLLPGGSIAMGRRALASRATDRVESDQLRDWLRARGIWVGALGTSAIVTKRAPTFLGGEIRRNWNWEKWASTVLDQVRMNGMSEDQQFLATVPEKEVQGALSTNEFGMISGKRVAWAYVVAGPSRGLVYDVLIVPSELLTRLSRLGVIVALVATFGFGRQMGVASHRRLLTFLLMASLLVAAMGSWVHHLLSVPLWTCVAMSVLLLLYRIFRHRETPANATSTAGEGEGSTAVGLPGLVVVWLGICFGFWPKSVAADDGPSRVLVPVTAGGDVKQVIVSDELIRRLKSVPLPTDRVLLERSEYRGEPSGTGKYRWQALLVGSVEKVDRDRPVSLALAGVELRRLVVNGVEVPDFRPTGPQSGIDFVVPQTGDQGTVPFRVEVEFDSAAIGMVHEHLIRFRVPPSSVTEVRVGMEKEVVLDDASRAEGWQVTTIDGKNILTRESGPTDEVSVRWRSSTGGGDGKSPIDLESIRLVKVTDSLVDMTVLFRLSMTPDRHELVIPISKRFMLRELEGDGVRDWHLETFGEGRRAVHLELEPGQKTRQLVLRGDASLDPTGPFVLPDVRLEESGKETGVIGIVTTPGWESSIVGMESCRPTGESDFLATWSRLSRDAPPSPLRETLRVERSAGDPWPTMSLELTGREGSWLIDQEIDARLEPTWKTTIIEAKVQAKRAEQPAGPLVLELPPGARVVRVAGPQVRDWMEQADELSLFLSEGKTETNLIEMTLHVPWELSSKRITSRTTQSLAPLRWRRGTLRSTNWRITTSPGWVLAGPDAGASDVSRWSDTLVRQSAGVEPISVQVAPESRELSAETLTRVTVRDRQTEIEGIIQLHVDRGTIGRLEFRTRGGLRNLQWEVDQSTPPTSEERGGERIWVYRAGRKVSGDLTLRWRTSKLDDASGTMIPRVILDVPSRVRDWVSIVNLTGRKMELKGPGLVANPLPPTLAAMGLGIGGTTSPGEQTYLAESKDWQLSFSLDAQKSDAPAYVLGWCDHDLLVGQQGRVLGRTTWQLIDQSEGTVEIHQPASVEAGMISIDDQPLTAVEPFSDGMRLPLFLRGRPQRLVLEWSSPAPLPGEDIVLPTIKSKAPYETLVRVRHSVASPIRVLSEEGTDRIDWLVERLDRVVEEMEEKGPLLLNRTERLSALEELSIARSWGNQLQGLLRAHTAAKARASVEHEPLDHPLEDRARQIVDRRDQLEQAYLEKLGDSDREIAVSETNLLWNVSEGIPAPEIVYLRSEQPVVSLEVTSRSTFVGRLVTTNEWVRMAVSGMALVLVLNPWLWRSMRLYWPAPMLTAGLAWIFFADSPSIGVGLLVLAVIGSIRSVGRWLEGSVVDYVSTILIRPHQAGTGPDTTLTRR
jgi:hypothetical protein